MKIVQMARFGRPEDVAECIEVTAPGEPGPGQVVAEVEAFPINPADLHALEGVYAEPPPLPARLGAEAVGRVTTIGAGVAELVPGDRVIFLCRENWATQRRVEAGEVVRLPDALQGEIDQALVLQAAMLKVNPATAYLLLRNYVALEPGDWVVQNAANSAVGGHLVRLARAEGWRTVNIVRSAEAAARVEAAGCDAVLMDGPDLADRVKAATGGAMARLGIDALAGDHCLRLADCLAPGGTLVTYGRLSGEPCRVDAHHFIFRQLTHTGFWLSPALARLGRERIEALYAELAGCIASGVLKASVEATYPIEDIKAAVAHARRGGRSGKVLVTPSVTL